MKLDAALLTSVKNHRAAINGHAKLALLYVPPIRRATDLPADALFRMADSTIAAMKQ